MITGNYIEAEDRTYINATCVCCRFEDTWDFEGRVTISQHMELLCEACREFEERPEELVAKWNYTEERNRRAAEIRKVRRMLAGLLDRRARSAMNELMARQYGGSRLPKWTREAMTRYADELLAFGNSDWPSHDTEYYSACGWDDYQSEARYEARNDAREIRFLLASMRIG